MLMEYFVRYLLSSCFNGLHGYSLQEKQNREPSVLSVQFFILQFKRVLRLSCESILQPSHLLFSRRYAMQMPQFIPQGAIKIDGILVFVIIIRTNFCFTKNVSLWFCILPIHYRTFQPNIFLRLRSLSNAWRYSTNQ